MDNFKNMSQITPLKYRDIILKTLELIKMKNTWKLMGQANLCADRCCI